MFASLAAAFLLSHVPPALQGAQDPDGPIVTADRGEGAESERLREAVAYANPLPAGAPENDYALIAWCEAMVNGHIAVGETLTDRNPEDIELIRLARLEATDFRAALQAGAARQSPATQAAAQSAAAAVTARWAPIMERDEAGRSRAFGMFEGLPGRCEHAARRMSQNITTPPATPREVGLE